MHGIDKLDAQFNLHDHCSLPKFLCSVSQFVPGPLWNINTASGLNLLQTSTTLSNNAVYGGTSLSPEAIIIPSKCSERSLLSIHFSPASGSASLIWKDVTSKPALRILFSSAVMAAWIWSGVPNSWRKSSGMSAWMARSEIIIFSCFVGWEDILFA